VTNPETVPVIDVSGAIDGRSVGPVAAAIDLACREAGFFQIVGHGVDLDLFDAVYESAPDLWNLPPEVKHHYHSPTDHPFQGWYTKDDAEGHPLQEKWEIISFDSPADALAHGVPAQYTDHFRPNLWPDAAPRFVAATKACFAATRALGDRVMGMFAVALGLDEEFFAPAVHNDSSYFAVNNYPGVSTLDPGEVALFEHTDSGTLTLLHQRGTYEGLQVKFRSGARYRLPIIPVALVVNIGDFIARWTNDRWVATPHRVVMGQPGDSRTSITTFHTPAIDAVVAPVPSCVDADGTTYDPVMIYDWEPQFLSKTYA
jgi:isopenicillin N synthase-like dioxygenase